jgi:hypothetical protein
MQFFIEAISLVLRVTLWILYQLLNEELKSLGSKKINLSA